MLKKKLKKFKTELFYWRQILQMGLPFSRWIAYAKNKYFGMSLLKKLQPWPSAQTDDFELHVLTQQEALWMTVMSLRSFLFHSGLRPKIVIHDDGSMDADSAGLMRSKFPGAEVLLRSEADKIVEERTDISRKLKEYRRKGKIILKFTDSFLFCKSKKILIFDNDLLFFSKPTEVIDFMNGASKHEAEVTEQFEEGLWMSDDLGLDRLYQEKYALLGKKMARVNTGLMCIEMEKFNAEDLNEYFEHTLMRPDNYFIEAAGWCALIARLNFSYLPENRYHIRGGPNKATVMKHFTSPRRFELYAYGIDNVMKQMTASVDSGISKREMVGKIVVITGASLGIGAETAYAFARAGSRLILTYHRDHAEAEQVAAKCLELGAPNVDSYKLDLTDNDSIRSVAEKVKAKFQYIDILINNAGVILWNLAKDMTFDEIDEQLGVNLGGLIKMTNICLPFVREKILNIASKAAFSRVANASVYVASKFGVRGFTQSIAKELPQLKIYCINPAATATRMSDFGGEKTEKVAQVIFNAASDVYDLPSGSDINVWELI